MDNVYKKCTKCRENKLLSEFYKRTISSDGLQSQCKRCQKKWQINNPEVNQRYYQNHKLICQERKRKWYMRNKFNYNFRRNLRRQKRRKEDIIYLLSESLRNRLRMAIKNNQKAGSAVKDLGCSIIKLRKHLERQFYNGMDWNNYGHGKNKWNIDHVIPLSRFDLTDERQFKKACHYTNLQPLWHSENCRKKDKIE